MKQGAFLLLATLLLVSCGKDKKSETPKGQVVATVDGQEITASELRLEMPGTPRDPALAAAAQQTALQSLISRKLLVAEAKRRDLVNSPLAAMMRRRAEDLAMVQLLQFGIASGVPNVSNEEVKEFVASHPSTFSQRRLISVDQLVVPLIDKGLIAAMEPLDTLEQIEQLLTSRKVNYFRSAGVLDTLNVDPDAAKRVSEMTVSQVFISPNGSGGVLVSRITGSRLEPLTGEDVDRVARVMLAQQRNTSQVRRAMEQIVTAGQSKVKINESYTVPSQPAAQGPAAKPQPAR